MLIWIVSTHFLTIQIERRIKILDLPAEMDAKLTDIVALYLSNTGFPLAQGFPCRGQIIPERGNHSQSGYDYTRHHITSDYYLSSLLTWRDVQGRCLVPVLCLPSVAGSHFKDAYIPNATASSCKKRV